MHVACQCPFPSRLITMFLLQDGPALAPAVGAAGAAAAARNGGRHEEMPVAETRSPKIGGAPAAAAAAGGVAAGVAGAGLASHAVTNPFFLA